MIQESQDLVLFQVVPDGELPADLAVTLQRKLTRVLGMPTRVEVQLLDDIPSLPSGKRRVVISKLAKAPADNQADA